MWPVALFITVANAGVPVDHTPPGVASDSVISVAEHIVLIPVIGNGNGFTVRPLVA